MKKDYYQLAIVIMCCILTAGTFFFCVKQKHLNAAEWNAIKNSSPAAQITNIHF